MRRMTGVAIALAVAAGANLSPASAQQAQRSFPSPEAAMTALVDAIARNDNAATEAIVGPDFADLLEAQGSEANAADRQRFLASAKEALSFRPMGDGRVTVEIGLAAWPLPAPLVQEAGGWRFDGEEGVEAVKDRVVGRNELNAIEVLRAYVDAQRTYATVDHDGDKVLEYAQRLGSTPGKQDGLYYQVGAGDAPSPFGPFLASAGVNPEQRDSASPYFGYLFRVMTRQGPNVPGGEYDYVINGNMIAGFAMVAWPADYGESGVMTFVVNQSGEVLERDMGRDTDKIGPRMLTYNPDASWKPVDN